MYKTFINILKKTTRKNKNIMVRSIHSNLLENEIFIIIAFSPLIENYLKYLKKEKNSTSLISQRWFYENMCLVFMSREKCFTTQTSWLISVSFHNMIKIYDLKTLSGWWGIRDKLVISLTAWIDISADLTVGSWQSVCEVSLSAFWGITPSLYAMVGWSALPKVRAYQVKNLC